MNRRRTIMMFSAVALTSATLLAATIPLNLPRPDGQPGNPKKPVKVYILAGQSNMVGMGDISGAKARYPTVYLSADPALIPGVIPVGTIDNGKAVDFVPVARHGLFEAKASLYDDPAKPPLKTIPVALGTVTEKLPATEGTQSVGVTALLEVPVTGLYTVHAGFEASTHAVATLDNKEVYRKEINGQPAFTKVALETGKRYPLAIRYFKSGSAAFWLQQVDIEGCGDLELLTKKEKKFQYLLDDAGKWSVRNDVYFYEARLTPEGKGAPMSAESNKRCLPKCNSIGPEVGFGYVMGTFHDEQVLLIKTAQGNRSLGFDFRPPSSGPTTNTPSQYEGFEYRAMVEGVRKTLNQIDKVVPGYQGQGYEMAGFCWFQGHKDSGAPKEEYEKHLVNLINDLRKEFKAPKMPAVVATVGFHGYRIVEGPWKGIWEAQMAVGDPKQHPEFVGTVASVDTRDFWREIEESPRNQDYHYNRNPETYLLVGEAMGRAMVRLLGGEAEAIPKTDREARTAVRVAAEAAEAAKPAPTDAQKAASLIALKPIILDGALVTYVSNPRNRESLQMALKGTKPAKMPTHLEDTLDEVADYYRAIGIQAYDWKPFGGEMKEGAWEYYGFDLAGTQAKTNGIKDLKQTAPVGMENWSAPDFDAKKAGWKSSVAPFGVEKDTNVYPEWYKGSPRIPPKTVCEKDVLLLRQSFDLPSLKEGYRYRIRVYGSVHSNSGEGYAIYVNGKLLAESKAGVTAWRREGAKPRGGHISPEFRGDFKGGKVTIGVANFPMNNAREDGFIPARAPLSVWMEEMKLPPLGEEKK
jgi:alpha-galactosidase